MRRQYKNTSQKLRSAQTLRQSFSVFRYSVRALGLVWTTNRNLTIALAILTLVAGLLPGAIAYISKLIVDSVLLASRTGDANRWTALGYVGWERSLLCYLQAVNVA